MCWSYYDLRNLPPDYEGREADEAMLAAIAAQPHDG